MSKTIVDNIMEYIPWNMDRIKYMIFLEYPQLSMHDIYAISCAQISISKTESEVSDCPTDNNTVETKYCFRPNS